MHIHKKLEKDKKKKKKNTEKSSNPTNRKIKNRTAEPINLDP